MSFIDLLQFIYYIHIEAPIANFLSYFSPLLLNYHLSILETYCKQVEREDSRVELVEQLWSYIDA